MCPGFGFSQMKGTELAEMRTINKSVRGSFVSAGRYLVHTKYVTSVRFDGHMNGTGAYQKIAEFIPTHEAYNV